MTRNPLHQLCGYGHDCFTHPRPGVDRLYPPFVGLSIGTNHQIHISLPPVSEHQLKPL